MPIIDIYDFCRQELKKWHKLLEEKQMCLLEKEEKYADAQHLDESEKRIFFGQQDKYFKEDYQLLNEGLSRIDSLLEKIRNDPSIENGKQLVSWMRILKNKSMDRVKAIENDIINNINWKSLRTKYKNFGNLLNGLIDFAEPIVEEVDKAMPLLDRLQRLNASCQDFVDDKLKQCRINKRVTWCKESFFSYKKQKMQSATSSSSEPFSPDDQRQEFSPSKKGETSKNNDLMLRLKFAIKYLDENYQQEDPETYVKLIEQLATEQNLVHHDAIDTLIRQLLIGIQSINGYEDYTIKAKGYYSVGICSQGMAKEEVTPLVDDTITSLTQSI